MHALESKAPVTGAFLFTIQWRCDTMGAYRRIVKMTEKAAYKLLARRVIGQAILDAEGDIRIADLYDWLASPGFDLWCQMAELPTDECKALIEKRLTTLPSGEARVIPPFQRYMMTPRFSRFFAPGKSVDVAFDDYGKWLDRHRLSDGKGYVKRHVMELHVVGLDMVKTKAGTIFKSV